MSRIAHSASSSAGQWPISPRGPSGRAHSASKIARAASVASRATWSARSNESIYGVERVGLAAGLHRNGQPRSGVFGDPIQLVQRELLERNAILGIVPRVFVFDVTRRIHA